MTRQTVLLMAIALSPWAWPASAERVRPFLCRDAVVRESDDVADILEGGPPAILRGSARQSLTMSVENAEIARAAEVMATYIEKITGVKCPISAAQGEAGLIGNGSFEEPPLPDTPETTRGPLQGSLSGEWIVYHNTVAKAHVLLDTKNYRGGKVSASITGVAHLSGLVRRLDLGGGRRFRISLWYRTAVESGAAFCGIVHIKKPIRMDLPASREWKRFTTEFVADNPRGNWLQLILGLRDSKDGQSQVWFDDVRVEEVGNVLAVGPDAWRIHVGAVGDPVKSFPELEKADDHGFLIATKDKHLSLVGRSGTGTLYAVWFFLQNYAGLRIVGPGEMGEVYPKHQALSIPRELYVLNPGPDYLLRVWSQRDFDHAAWLQDRGGTMRFDFHHASHRIFPPGKYGKTHPEYYPVWDRKRYIPLPRQRSHWQPTYSEPAAVKRAIEYTDGQFTWRPDLRSVSVTVTDGGGFSDLDKDEDGRVVSAYYRYVNAVARGIKEKWPDKYVAFISYAHVRHAPAFKLEDNVMLFLMSFEGNLKPVYDEWKGKVRNFGVYQWLYGAGWAVPNHWPHGIQDYLRWLRSIGGKAFKGEACIGFSQGGPKMWVLANLLWNVDADVDALLRDYYEHAYGKEAAPAVARYFAQAEQMYERRRTPTEHNIVRHQPGPYQFKLAEEEDFETMASALAEAKQLVRGEANRTRLDWTTRNFELSRRYWNAHRAFERAKAFSDGGLKTDDDCRAFCRSVADFYRSREEIELYREAKCVPVPLGYCVAANRDNPPGGMWVWLDSGFREWCDDAPLVTSFSAITNRLRKQQTSQEVAQFWRGIGEELPYAKPYAEHQQYLLLHKERPMTNYLTNGSFETPPAPDDPRQERLLADAQAKRLHYIDWNDYDVTGLCARDWVKFSRSVRTYSAKRTAAEARDGKTSLCLTGTGRYGGILHDVKAPNNRARYRVSLWYRTAGKFRSGTLGVAFYGLRSLPRKHIGLTRSPQWRRVALELTSNYPPEQARFTVALMFHRSASPDAEIWFDDVRLEMLSPAGLAKP